MYEFLLLAHSWLRWVALALVAAALVRVVGGMRSGAARTPVDRKVMLFAMISVDVQLLLGLVLYAGVSPITSAAFSNMGAAMKEPQLRYFAVEHITAMVLGIGFFHAAFSRFKRAVDDAAAFKGAARFLGLAAACLVLGVPWLIRPWFRF